MTDFTDLIYSIAPAQTPFIGPVRGNGRTMRTTFGQSMRARRRRFMKPILFSPGKWLAKPRYEWTTDFVSV